MRSLCDRSRKPGSSRADESESLLFVLVLALITRLAEKG